YEAFSFYDDHIEEIRSDSTTTQSDNSLPEYDSFIFDLSNDQFPPTDRSDFTHEEFGDEPAHIISPPEYDCYDYSPLLAYVVWIFLAYLTIPEKRRLSPKDFVLKSSFPLHKLITYPNLID
nr:hypothetical protein [Tanacetum cinerariifolium]